RQRAPDPCPHRCGPTAADLVNCALDHCGLPCCAGWRWLEHPRAQSRTHHCATGLTYAVGCPAWRTLAACASAAWRVANSPEVMTRKPGSNERTYEVASTPAGRPWVVSAPTTRRASS